MKNQSPAADTIANVSIDPRFLVADLQHELARHLAIMRTALRALEDGSYRESGGQRANPNLILFSTDLDVDSRIESQRIMRSALQSIFRSFGEFVDNVLAFGEIIKGTVQIDRSLKSRDEVEAWIHRQIRSRAAEIGSDKRRTVPAKIREIGPQPQWLLDATDNYFTLRRTVEHHHSIAQADFALSTYRVRITTASGTQDVQLGDHFGLGQIETFWEKREQRVPQGRVIVLAEEGVELLAMSLGVVVGPAMVVTMVFPDNSINQPEFPELTVKLTEELCDSGY